VRNPGGGVRLRPGLTIAFTVVAVGVVVVILRLLPRLRSTPGRSRSGWCSAGQSATSSTGSSGRPGPGRGHVVDFLELPHWPVFNLA
jgi:signal peptidase II